jgi:predicted O-methyltransferase YrrM
MITTHGNVRRAGVIPDRSKALSLMQSIVGWFSEAEAELLLATVTRALRELTDDCAVVEIGSYLGRSTVLLASTVRDLRPRGQVVAIDPHGGEVGIAGDLDRQGVSTYEAFCANMVAADMQDVVRTIRKRSTDTSWDQPIGLLFVDGLHDYDSVSADFGHFERWIRPGGFVAFHDYSHHWPGVVQFVDEVRNGHDYEWVDGVQSLIVLQKMWR